MSPLAKILYGSIGNLRNASLLVVRYGIQFGDRTTVFASAIPGAVGTVARGDLSFVAALCAASLTHPADANDLLASRSQKQYLPQNQLPSV